MRVLSLFSGGGLGDYGLELAGMEIVGQVEIDEYCQKILKLRWPEVPKWRDVKTFDGKAFVKKYGQPDLISGGFPCQDISQAGRGAGIGGERSGLWKEMLRIICEVRPSYVLVENVAALLRRGLGVVLGDLAQSGYDSEWICLFGKSVGIPQRRERVFIVSHTAQSSPQEIFYKNPINAKSNYEGFYAKSGKLSNPNLQNNRESHLPVLGHPNWTTIPNRERSGTNDGIANRMDRHRIIGNGQVVQVVQYIGERIIEFDGSHNRH